MMRLSKFAATALLLAFCVSVAGAQPQPGNYVPTRAGDSRAFYDARTAMSFYANAAAAAASGTDALITLTRSSGTAATSTGTSFTPTSGKKFRITSFSVATRGHATATAQITEFRLRINTAGACTASSTPLVLAASTATPATSSAWDRYTIPIDDGYEVTGDGTLQFCLSAVSTYVTNAPTLFVNIVGFEY